MNAKNGKYISAFYYIFNFLILYFYIILEKKKNRKKRQILDRNKLNLIEKEITLANAAIINI